MKIPFLPINNKDIYDDGTCHTLVNAKFNVGGSIVPVRKKKIVRRLFNTFDYLFYHQLNDLESFIGLIINKEDNSTDVWQVGDDENDYTKIATINDVILSIEQTGYILSLISETNMYSVLYTSNVEGSSTGYFYLGELPELPKIDVINNYKFIKRESLDKAGLGEFTSENSKEKIKAWVYKMRSDSDTHAGKGVPFYLYDLHLMTYGFRLYDGTVIRQSVPTLICPNLSESLNRKLTTRYKDGNIVKSESYLRIMGSVYFFKHDFTEFYEKLNSGWKELIKSIDIFISRPLGFTSPEGMQRDFNFGRGNRPGKYDIFKFLEKDEVARLIDGVEGFYYYCSLDLNSKALIEPNNDVSIPHIYRAVSNKYCFPFKDHIESLENLKFNEKLDFSMNDYSKVGAKHSYNYNNRIHLANITSTYFKGLNYGNFHITDVVPDDIFKVQYKINDRPGEGIITEEFPCGFNGVQKFKEYDPVSNLNIRDIVIRYKLNVAGGFKYVFSDFNENVDSLSYSTSRPFMNAFLCYPDNRAEQFDVILRRMDGTQVILISGKMNKHPLLNISYYIHGDITYILSNINGHSGDFSEFKITPIMDDIKDYKVSDIVVSDDNVYLKEPNKIKLSEINNPMVLPNKNTYLIGNGEILSMSSNAMRVSEGQFGQYPLYVFTTKGIYAMNVGGGDSVYAAISSPISFDVSTGPICSTNNGVVFVSDSQIKFLGGGQQVASLSNAVEQNSLEMLFDGFKYRGWTNQLCIKDVINDIVGLDFNSFDNELFVRFTDKLMAIDVIMVISLENGSIYFDTDTYDSSVKNAYPKLLTCNKHGLKDYSIVDDDNSRRVLISTRPIKFGYDGYKQITRAKIIGNINMLKDADRSSIMMFYSNSIYEALRPLRGGVVDDNILFNNFDYGMLIGVKQRYVSMVIDAKLKCDNSYISYMDFLLDKEYNEQDKLR